MQVKVIKRGDRRKYIILKRRGKGKMVPTAVFEGNKSDGQEHMDQLEDFLLAQGLPKDRQE